jgi:hypothetical protein
MKIPKHIKLSVVFLFIFYLGYKPAICQVIDMHMHLDFLTEEEKEMILYKNAKVFLGIKNQTHELPQ